MTLLTFRREFTPLHVSESVVQFGADPAHRIQTTEEWQRALIAELQWGIRSDALALTTFATGAPRDQSQALLQALTPALCERELQRAVPVRTESLSAPDGALEYRVREALLARGGHLSASDAGDAVTVLVVAGAVAPMHGAPFMRDDRAFLPLAYELGGVRVGPLVVPGGTPCLMCRDLTLADEDVQWPALQVKLIGRRPPQSSVDQTQLAVGVASELLAEDRARAAGRWAIVTNSRRVIWRQCEFHEDCGCQRP